MPSRLQTLIELLHAPGEIAMGVHSVSLPGHPFVTLLNFMPDAQHCPVLLTSQLAEHTQCVLADGRASVAVARDLGDGEIARASLIGAIEKFEPAAELRARYLRYHPAAERFLQLGDFHFYRFVPQRIRVVGGFAQAGWLDGQALLSAPQITLDAEASLLAQAQKHLPPDTQALGIDAFGLDYLQAGLRKRHRFANAPATREAALKELRTL